MPKSKSSKKSLRTNSWGSTTDNKYRGRWRRTKLQVSSPIAVQMQVERVCGPSESCAPGFWYLHFRSVTTTSTLQIVINQCEKERKGEGDGEKKRQKRPRSRTSLLDGTEECEWELHYFWSFCSSHWQRLGRGGVFELLHSTWEGWCFYN
jgi:hypothetical protein